ncbi:unnamed protein product [Clonostachys chloroleuca]|uniref:Uncharacterized protein n=1 Tax=Clonostachys chloroleuca TaxID=1926264 RepID=A0AA35VMP4_9HYPO|nr:unnamed protein product [Clonostachys chloroleuca]
MTLCGDESTDKFEDDTRGSQMFKHVVDVSDDILLSPLLGGFKPPGLYGPTMNRNPSEARSPITG